MLRYELLINVMSPACVESHIKSQEYAPCEQKLTIVGQILDSSIALTLKGYAPNSWGYILFSAHTD